MIGLGGAALRTSRMIVWWAPVAAYYLAIHAAATWRRFRRGQSGALVASRITASPGWAFAAAVTICGIAACTPLGIVLLHGTRTDPHESLSTETPLGATDYLNSHPPRGQIFNAFEWGDYLLSAGPKESARLRRLARAPGADRCLAGLHAGHQSTQWLGGDSGPLRREHRGPGSRAARGLRAQPSHSDAWSLGYEDDRSVIFLRRHPK